MIKVVLNICPLSINSSPAKPVGTSFERLCPKLKEAAMAAQTSFFEAPHSKMWKQPTRATGSPPLNTRKGCFDGTHPQLQCTQATAQKHDFYHEARTDTQRDFSATGQARCNDACARLPTSASPQRSCLMVALSLSSSRVHNVPSVPRVFALQGWCRSSIFHSSERGPSAQMPALDRKLPCTFFEFDLLARSIAHPASFQQISKLDL